MFLEALDDTTRSALYKTPADRLLTPADALQTAPATAHGTIPTIETNHHDETTANHHASNLLILHQSNNPPTLQTSLPCFNDLIAVLIECFSLIAIGYLSGRFRVISPEARDLSGYLSTFALPMIIFLNIAQMEIRTINLSFLICMLISKLVIFALVSLVTLAISYPSNFGYAGALSILSTQSNDFALGYPLFKSLYGESKPEMLNYLNLMGPIQLLIINPLGIIMLEYGKSRAKLRRMRQRLNSTSSNATIKQCDVHHGGPGDEVCATSNGGGGGGGGYIRRKINSKSLVLVMPGRRVSDSDDSIGTYSTGFSDHQQQQAGGDLSGRTPDPTLLSDLSANDVAAPTQSPPAYRAAVTPAARPNWRLSAFHYFNKRNNIRPAMVSTPQRVAMRSPQPSTSCSCAPAAWTGGGGGGGEPPMASCEPESSMIDLGFIRALLTNPLIIMSLLALAVNLIHGPELPKFVTKVSNTIAASFAAPALLVVGLSMYGKFKLILRNPNDLLLSSVLVITKVMVLPNIMRAVMQVVLPYYVDAKELPYLVDFSYLYGLLPTAPGACIIAKQYEVLTNVVSICMLLSTFISAPLMLGTSVVISKAASITPQAIALLMGRVMKVSSSLTITLCLLTLYFLWKSNKPTLRAFGRALIDAALLKSGHLFIILLTLAQLLAGMGGFYYLFVDTSSARQKHGAFQMGATQTGGNHDNDDDDTDSLSDELQHRPTQTLAMDSLEGGGGSSHDDQEGVLVLSPEERFHLLNGRYAGGAGGFHSLACTMSFIQASGGIMLAKFFILCMVVTNYARLARGHQVANQVAALMLRVSPLLLMGIVMCLVLESKHLTCQPTEASLPHWAFSLYMRLVFDAVLLGLTLSLFVATFRLKNKLARQRRDNLMERHHKRSAVVAAESAEPVIDGQTLLKRQFVASNVSISSGTSSEMTTSTNLDTSAVNYAAGAGAAASTSQNHIVLLNNQLNKSPVIKRKTTVTSIGSGITIGSNSRQVADTTNILIDYARLQQPNVAAEITDKIVDTNNNRANGLPQSAPTATVQRHESLYTNSGSGAMYTSNVTSSSSGPAPAPASSIQFDRESVLVVFLLFQTMLNITSILQVLFQTSSASNSTTFIMVQLTKLAVDLGQGLMTFLVVGAQFMAQRTLNSAFETTRRSRQTTDREGVNHHVRA